MAAGDLPAHCTRLAVRQLRADASIHVQAGDNDGSFYVRPMTEAELAQQSKAAQAVI